MYKIKRYSYLKAAQLGVKIKPSNIPGKKIDVFKNNVKIASIGQIGYLDYPTYIKKFGLQIANDRRRLYHLRHSYYKQKGSPGYYAAKILW